MSKFTDQKVQFFSSGSTLLDLALGGGWALPRVFNIVGDKSTGKTLLAIEAFANFSMTFANPRMRYAESESAFDEVYADVLGFPTNVERPNDLIETVEEFITDFNDFISKGGPGLYILDSLDALSDEAELKKFEKSQKPKVQTEDEEETKEKGSYGVEKAKKMSKLFRMLNGKAAEANCCLGVVSQVRDNIGIQFGEKQTRSGGKALDFYCSQILWLKENKKLTRSAFNETRAIGVNVTGRVKKCKVGYPFREADFDIIFSYGIDNENSMIDWLLSIKQMDPATVKVLKSQLSKARDKRDYVALNQITEQLKADTTRLWKKIEEELAPPMRKYDQQGPLAQMVEQGTHNPPVEGSSPSGPTNSFPHEPLSKSIETLNEDTSQLREQYRTGTLPKRSNDWRDRFPKKEEANGVK